MTKKGFTLIEAILTMMLLSAGIVGVFTLYHKNIAVADEMEQTVIATALAQEKLEQIIHDKKYNLYAYVTQANYTSPEDLTSIGYPGYTRTTTIQEVLSSDLTTPPQGQQSTGYKRVTVSVQVSGGGTYTFETLVTEWGEE